MTLTIQSDTYFADQLFKNLSQRSIEVVASEFHDCTFDKCSLAESVWRRCRFSHCVFRACDLNLIKVPDVIFTAVRFEDTSLMGVDWTQAYFLASRLARPFDFFRCNLNHGTFIGLELREIRIQGCSAADVDFREAILSQADFSDTDLSQSLFFRTDLSNADLSQARNYSIAPTQNSLKEARFSLPEALALLSGLEIILVDGDGEPWVA